MPIGLALIPLALRRLDETTGSTERLDLPGLVLASAGLLGIVWGLVRGNGQGWASPAKSLSIQAPRQTPFATVQTSGLSSQFDGAGAAGARVAKSSAQSRNGSA